MEQTLFNPDMESISASDQEKLEKSLLLDQIEYVYGHSKMYQDKFSKAGITKDKIKDVKDLALLPFTSKQELRNSQKRLAPFGDFLDAPAEKINRVHRTSGATVLPFGVGNSRQLIQVIKDAGINAISSTPSYPRHLEKIIKTEFNMEPAELI